MDQRNESGLIPDILFGSFSCPIWDCGLQNEFEIFTVFSNLLEKLYRFSKYFSSGVKTWWTLNRILVQPNFKANSRVLSQAVKTSSVFLNNP